MKFFLTIATLSIFSSLSIAMGPSYFLITKPAAGDQWPQGQAHSTTWKHAVDNIDVVDVELARIGSSGLLFVSREVPTSWGSLNVYLDSVPPGDDYYFVFLNVTHGGVYSISERFTILDSSSTSANSSAQLAPDASKPTVTVTGAPGPLQTWGTTFGPQAAGAVALWSGLADGRTTMVIASALVSAALGGVMLVL